MFDMTEDHGELCDLARRVEEQDAIIDSLRAENERLKTPSLARNQPCGCIVCNCAGDEKCYGCGAKNCGTHPPGEIPNPVYEDHPVIADNALLTRRLEESQRAVIEGQEGIRRLQERNEGLSEECTRYIRQLKYYQNAVCFDPPNKWWAVDGADSVPAIEPKRLETILERNALLEKVAEAAEVMQENAMPVKCGCSACANLRAALAALEGK